MGTVIVPISQERSHDLLKAAELQNPGCTCPCALLPPTEDRLSVLGTAGDSPCDLRLTEAAAEVRHTERHSWGHAARATEPALTSRLTEPTLFPCRGSAPRCRINSLLRVYSLQEGTRLENFLTIVILPYREREK